MDIASWLKNLVGILERCGATPDNKNEFNVFRSDGNFAAVHSLVEYLDSCRYLQTPSQLVELPAHIIHYQHMLPAMSSKANISIEQMECQYAL